MAIWGMLYNSLRYYGFVVQLLYYKWWKPETIESLFIEYFLKATGSLKALHFLKFHQSIVKISFISLNGNMN